jgi:hypothetical protein
MLGKVFFGGRKSRGDQRYEIWRGNRWVVSVLTSLLTFSQNENSIYLQLIGKVTYGRRGIVLIL